MHMSNLKPELMVLVIEYVECPMFKQRTIQRLSFWTKEKSSEKTKFLAKQNPTEVPNGKTMDKSEIPKSQS